MFHTWGFAGLQISLALGATMVLRRKFAPADCLADIERSKARVLVVVPVMLQRMLELPAAERTHDTSSLRIIAASGSAIGAPLVKKVLDEFGPVLYNLYGSTEVSWVSIATPEELRAHPATAGRAPVGTELALLDDDGNPVDGDDVGRVFVGNGMLFEGYTRAGEGKEVVRGMMCTGDLGHLDDDGLLYIDGRSDDMVVSGGENTYPGESRTSSAGSTGCGRWWSSGWTTTTSGPGWRPTWFASRTAPANRWTPTPSASTSRRTWRGSACLGTWCSSTRCPATPPARSSPASYPSPRGDRPAHRVSERP